MIQTDAGRRELLRELVLTYQARLRSYLYSRTGNAEIADDLAQETFLAVFRRIDQYDSSRPVWPWIMGIARNELLNYYRAASTARRRVDDRLDLLVAQRLAADDPHEAAVESIDEQKQSLSACLRRLAPRARELVTLIYIERMNCSEVAKLWKQTSGAVRTAIYRIRKALETCMQGKISRRVV